jgi:hypothetical protein
MAGLYFGATENTVLARVQNTNLDASVIQGDIPTMMGDSYDKIVGKMPDKMSNPIDVGKVEGHIIVDSANALQEAIDGTQLMYSVITNMHLFLNYSGCNRIPVNNVDTEMVLDTDYTIPVAGEAPDFAIKPLGAADNIIANYNTTWVNNEGLGDLRDMLEEDVALRILQQIGISDNPNLLENTNTRITTLENKMMQLQKGELTPRGLQFMTLRDEVSTNDESHFATVTKVKRG